MIQVAKAVRYVVCLLDGKLINRAKTVFKQCGKIPSFAGAR